MAILTSCITIQTFLELLVQKYLQQYWGSGWIWEVQTTTKRMDTGETVMI
jgi:hypothetical protein